MLVVTVAWSVCNKQISVHTLAPLTAMPFHTTGREIGAGASVTPELWAWERYGGAAGEGETSGSTMSDTSDDWLVNLDDTAEDDWLEGNETTWHTEARMVQHRGRGHRGRVRGGRRGEPGGKGDQPFF
jgi:hypothetical protein